MNDAEILEYQAKCANAIVAKLNAVRHDEPITHAIELLLSRIVGAGSSI
jgi:hypothetical protein